MKKKFVATILSVVLILSLMSVPAFANPAGDFDVGGDIIVLPHVIEVTLPTTAFEFFVDPEGIMDADHTGGEIVFTGGTPSFINRSSKDIMLGIEARITTAAEPGATQVTVVSTEGALTAAESTVRNVWVTVTPSTANVATVGGSFAGEANATALATTPTLFRFVLPAAAFEVTGTGDDMARTIHPTTPALQGTQISLAGAVNQNATWTGDEDFGVRVRFSFNAVPDPVPGTAMVGSAHLRQIQTNTEVFDTIVLVPPIALTRANNQNFTFAWNEQPSAARVASITIGGTTIPFVAAGPERTANRIVLSSIPSSIGAGTHQMVITLNDGTGSPFTFSVSLPAA